MQARTKPNDEDGLGSAGVLARRLRRLAEGIMALLVVHQKVNLFRAEASRRDADWRRSRSQNNIRAARCAG
jgi:hypothetical protein